MQFQWYPGHMTKAKRQMQEDIKLIDLVIELVDARIPLSSRNPDIDELGKNKARLILMNKSDLADEEAGKLWSAYFQKKGYYVVSLDSRNRNGMKQVTAVVMEACKEKIERDRKRGIMNRPVRAMVVGIPNVGKSTFINSYAGKACAKTGNKPGVTKGKQWIRLNKNVELLDTPGILWPKFEDQTVGLKLALIGAIKDEILNIDELSLELIKVLTAYYPGALQARYGTEELDIDETAAPAEILRGIAENRRCVAKGGEIDYSKAATLLIDEFRSGKLGRSHWSGRLAQAAGTYGGRGSRWRRKRSEKSGKNSRRQRRPCCLLLSKNTGRTSARAYKSSSSRRTDASQSWRRSVQGLTGCGGMSASTGCIRVSAGLMRWGEVRLPAPLWRERSFCRRTATSSISTIPRSSQRQSERNCTM